MNKTKEIFVVGFALFSMFFGAGNLILPPFLGAQAAENWLLVTIGFAITAVIIPILGILAYARLQGTMFDFGKKVSPAFSALYCFLVYLISVTLPAPRTASVTHEMAISPFFGSSSLLTSSIYFTLVLLFVINRAKIINLIGKFFTPFIVIILVTIIVIALFSSPEVANPSTFKTPIISGLLEGYQTFDAIGAVVVGGVIIISLKIKGYTDYNATKQLIKKAGLIAGICLFVIYTGLIVCGYLFNSTFETNDTRIQILTALSTQTLGEIGTTFLSVLVALACFTTAIGIVTGTSDYVRGLFKNSQLAYTITAIVSCSIGVIIGQFDVHYIINIALPALMFIYPITIVLIILNLLPEKYANPIIFKAVIIVTFLFSIPDFLKFIFPGDYLLSIQNIIPFAKQNLAWVLPALIIFFMLNIKNFTTNKIST